MSWTTAAACSRPPVSCHVMDKRKQRRRSGAVLRDKRLIVLGLELPQLRKLGVRGGVIAEEELMRLVDGVVLCFGGGAWSVVCVVW